MTARCPSAVLPPCIHMFSCCCTQLFPHLLAASPRSPVLPDPPRYHPALSPCVHYVPIWQHSETDVLGVVESLNGSPDGQDAAQRMAANGATFAAAHFSEAAVMAHWQVSAGFTQLRCCWLAVAERVCGRQLRSFAITAVG